MTAPTILDEAYHAIRGYRELTAAIEVVTARSAALRVAAGPDVAGEAKASVLAGDGVPDDLGARLLDAERVLRGRVLEADFLGRRVSRDVATGLLGELLYERDERVRVHADDGLAVLRAELADVLAAAADADATLGGAGDADAAVAAGAKQAAAWGDLSVLVGRYDALRTAQHRLVAAALSQDTPAVWATINDAGLLANLIALAPEWIARVEGVEPAPAAPPWPAPAQTRGAGHWPTTDRRAYLRWLTSGLGEPWLPTIAELKHKQEAMREAAAAPPPTPAEQAAHQRNVARDTRQAASDAAAASANRVRVSAGIDDWNS